MKKEFIKLRLSELIPYENNPRINDEAAKEVAESIKQTGNLDPIEIDENNVILSGHTRLKALLQLGYTETECIRFTGLSEAQKRKYRLLTNKTGEAAKWDIDMLAAELEGLDFDGFDFDFHLDIEERQRAKATNFSVKGIDPLPRLQHNTFDNFDSGYAPSVIGKYDIPVMEVTETAGDEFARFCDWKEVDEPASIIAHFFYDDYKFIQAWKDPNKYVGRLRQFKAVISPDFSLYTDMPMALQIMSCYRRQWMGAYWQSLGLDVIPDVIWGEAKTFEFCFDGVPTGGTVAVSSLGVECDPMWNGQEGNLFKQGYDEMLRRLNPKTVLFYGGMTDGLDGNIIRIPSYYEVKRQHIGKGGR